MEHRNQQIYFDNQKYISNLIFGGLKGKMIQLYIILCENEKKYINECCFH